MSGDDTSTSAAPSSEKPDDSKSDEKSVPTKVEKKKRRRRITWRTVGTTLLLLIVAGVIFRAFLPRIILYYVNDTINRSPVYEGKVEDIEVHLWRGAYTIRNIRISKSTGTIPVPLFKADRMELAVQWSAILEGKVVGAILIDTPELNFVDAGNATDNQTGAAGPWLGIIQDLFPFDINSARINNASAHFRAPEAKPPVDVYVSGLQAEVKNLTNIKDELKPLISTVTAKGKVMKHGDVEVQAKIDPFSYYPTFELALKITDLDVTELNDLTNAYGEFDFERGFFDLVVEVQCTQGSLTGYVKPLFRNIQVVSLKNDIAEDNVVQFFWEALVGTTTRVLRNAPREQFGTRIPIRGDLKAPEPDILVAVGNVLRNAFIRAYLPRLERGPTGIDNLQFDPGEITELGMVTEK